MAICRFAREVRPKSQPSTKASTLTNCKLRQTWSIRECLSLRTSLSRKRFRRSQRCLQKRLSTLKSADTRCKLLTAMLLSNSTAKIPWCKKRKRCAQMTLSKLKRSTKRQLLGQRLWIMRDKLSQRTVTSALISTRRSNQVNTQKGTSKSQTQSLKSRRMTAASSQLSMT